MKRNNFLKKGLYLSVGSLSMAKQSIAKYILNSETSAYLSSLSENKIADPIDFKIIDLHCHPSLKMYLFGKKIWNKHYPTKGTNEIAMQEGYEELLAGYTKGLIVTHYVLEKSAEVDWKNLKALFSLAKKLAKSLFEKFEFGNLSNIDQVEYMIALFKLQVDFLNQTKHTNLKIATNFSQFQSILAQGHIPIAHAIEGSHVLGKYDPTDEISYDEFENKVLDNLVKLKQKGVCLISVAHLFKNDFAYPVEGISPDEKKKLKMAWEYKDSDEFNLPLTGIGRKVVAKMLDLGILVDLTHSTPETRKEIFKLNNDRNNNKTEEEKQTEADKGSRIEKKRPLLFTHVGAQAIFEKYDKNQFPNYKFYDVSDEEILKIEDCGGVMGIIFENFWLVGADTHLKKYCFNKHQFKNGIDFVIETMEYINSKTKKKDYSSIGIGTDFDGFADAPADLYKPSQLGSLRDQLIVKGFNKDQIDSITYKNALRVLEKGWTD